MSSIVVRVVLMEVLLFSLETVELLVLFVVDSVVLVLLIEPRAVVVADEFVTEVDDFEPDTMLAFFCLLLKL